MRLRRFQCDPIPTEKQGLVRRGLKSIRTSLSSGAHNAVFFPVVFLRIAFQKPEGQLLLLRVGKRGCSPRSAFVKSCNDIKGAVRYFSPKSSIDVLVPADCVMFSVYTDFSEVNKFD